MAPNRRPFFTVESWISPGFFSEGSLGILFRAFKCRLSLYCPGHLYVGCPGTVRDTYMPAVLVLVPIGYVYTTHNTLLILFAQWTMRPYSPIRRWTPGFDPVAAVSTSILVRIPRREITPMWREYEVFPPLFLVSFFLLRTHTCPAMVKSFALRADEYTLAL